MKILETKHLKKYYGEGDSLVKAVDDINISVEKGEFVAIVGTSGSGKTSLLNLLGGLDYADSGEVIIGGQSLLHMKDEERTVFRRRNIGFIFQNYNLVSMLNVYKNVVLPISRTSAEVMGLLQMTSREFNQTIIMITHNEEIAQLADRIIHLEDGKVVGGDDHVSKF